MCPIVNVLQESCYLLGDQGYPSQPSLLTPYAGPELSWGQTFSFSCGPLQDRARVEMVISILKSRFQCLPKLRVSPERACDIIVACVVLHNIAIIRGKRQPAVQSVDPEDDHLLHDADIQDGRAMRDIIPGALVLE